MLARYYLEIDAICIIVLACLAWQTVHSNFKKTNRIYFMRVLICNILFVYTDTVWIYNNGYVNYQGLPFDGRLYAYVLNGLNVCFSAISGWSWLQFSEHFQEHHQISSWKGRITSLLPVLVLLLLTLTTGETKFLFYITEDGRYVREGGYVLQVLIAYSYIAVAVVLSLLHARRAVTLQERNRSLAMASFAVFPTLACCLQMLHPNMSIVFIGTIVALLNVYIRLQGQQVLNDPLTGLNNRMLLDQKIMDRIHDLDGKQDFWLLIMDANKFKHINDNFGHMEGDQALRRIADVLRACSASGDFVCRYGGDEFVMLHNTPKNEDCSRLISEINRRLAAFSLPYGLSVSVGAAKADKTIEKWTELMEKADAELYKVKRSRQHDGR